MLLMMLTSSGRILAKRRLFCSSSSSSSSPLFRVRAPPSLSSSSSSSSRLRLQPRHYYLSTTSSHNILSSDDPPPSTSSSSSSSSSSSKGRRSPPQSFVQPDIELELGELETDLPPGFHNTNYRNNNYGQQSNNNDGRDAYWRPPWKNPRAEIISAEDYVNRPRVTFSESFLTMHDAMALESWMSPSDKDGMYQLYLDMMLATVAGQKSATNTTSTTAMNHNNNNNNDKRNQQPNIDLTNERWEVLSTNTSHEYVIRVVAQKYNVTTSRAAGVIQLQHNEEQLKKDPTFTVNHAISAYMDNKMREHIREVYQSYGEKEPLQFVEDPIVSTGRMGRGMDTASETIVSASELVDVDALTLQTRMEEIEKARRRIANHVYVEDVDDTTRLVPIDQEVKRLMKMNAKLKKMGDEDNENPITKEEADGGGEGKNIPFTTTTSATTMIKKHRLKIPKVASPFPDNNRGYNSIPETRRPRWKYAAQIINTQLLEKNPHGGGKGGKKAANRAKARRHGRIVEGNTLIEQDGILRVANVAELEQTSWKHVRNESEFMYKGVKDAWLRRQLQGEVGGWGLQEEVWPETTAKSVEAKKEEGDDNDDGDDVGEDDEEENASTTTTNDDDVEGETVDEE